MSGAAGFSKLRVVMAEHFIIWGAAGHALVVNELICAQGGRTICLVDNNPSVSSPIPGTEVVHGEAGLKSWLHSQSCDIPQIFRAVIAIGGSRGTDRIVIQNVLLDLGIDCPALISDSAWISPSANISQGAQVLPMACVAANCEIGTQTIVNHMANVDHECIVGKGVHLAPRAVLCGCVQVEDFAMIGAGAVVLPRLRIGQGAIVGAGAVITQDVPANAVMVGNPAKQLVKK